MDQAGFYVEPLSPEYQNDSKTPVRFVRKMVGIFGQSRSQNDSQTGSRISNKRVGLEAADVLKQMQDSRDIQRNSWAGRD